MQPRRQGSTRGPRPPAPPNQRAEAATTEPQTDERPPAAPGESSSELEDGAAKDVAPSKTSSTAVNSQKTTPSKILAETSKPPSSTVSKILAETSKAPSSSESQPMQIEPGHSLAEENTKPPADTVMVDGPVRVTRARSRKTQRPTSDQ